MTATSSTDTLDPEPAPPDDAIDVWDWDCDTADVFRYFIGTDRHRRGVSVTLVGFQNFTGSVRRWASVDRYDPEATELGADDLRALAADLLATAEELDALT